MSYYYLLYTYPAVNSGRSPLTIMQVINFLCMAQGALAMLTIVIIQDIFLGNQTKAIQVYQLLFKLLSLDKKSRSLWSNLRNVLLLCTLLTSSSSCWILRSTCMCCCCNTPSQSSSHSKVTLRSSPTSCWICIKD